MMTDTPWRWPLNVSRFDTTSPLTQSELQSLEDLLALYHRPGRVVGYAEIAQRCLPRLVNPVREALLCLNLAADAHSPVVYRFLQHSADAGQPYGCLTEDAWLPLLQMPAVGSLTPAVAKRSAYSFLLVLYLLRGFRSLHRLSKRHVTKMAHMLSRSLQEWFCCAVGERGEDTIGTLR